MIVNKKIKSLGAVNPKPWSGPNGDLWFVAGAFEDGGLFDRGAKSLDNANKLHAELTALIGQDGEFDIEDTGKEYQGEKKYRLKAWPGSKPQGGWKGGGGKEYVPRYRDTREGAIEEQASIHRSVALQRAIEADSNREPDAILALAETFYAWLRKTAPAAEQPQKAPAPAEQPQAPPKPVQREVAAEPERRVVAKPTCPKCGDSEFVLEDREKKGEFFCWKNASRNKFGCGHKWSDIKQKALDVGVEGDSLLSSYEQYQLEILRAAAKKDIKQLERLQILIGQAFDNGSLEAGDASALDLELQAAKRKAHSPAEPQAQWESRKKAEAMANDPLTKGMPTEQEIPF